MHSLLQSSALSLPAALVRPVVRLLQATGMPALVVMSPPMHTLPAGHSVVVTVLTTAAATGEA
jgi:hypothetical protein